VSNLAGLGFSPKASLWGKEGGGDRKGGKGKSSLYIEFRLRGASASLVAAREQTSRTGTASTERRESRTLADDVDVADASRSTGHARAAEACTGDFATAFAR